MKKSDLGTDQRWNSFYKLAAITALLIVVAGLMDTITSMPGGEAHENSSVGIVEWFKLFETISAPGGLLLITYHILPARRLLQLAR